MSASFEHNTSMIRSRSSLDRGLEKLAQKPASLSGQQFTLFGGKVS
jgi:hypothetical protein